MALRFGRESTNTWRHNAQRWLDNDVVASDQAHSSVERKGSNARAPLGGASAGTGRGLSSITEVVSYVGVSVGGVAGVALIGHSWSGLSEAAKVTLGVLAALAGLIGGEFVSRIGGAGAKRLGGLLWLGGTGGAAMTVAEVLQITGVHRRGISLLLVGFTVMTIGAVLWRNQDRPLQFLTTVTGLALFFGGLESAAHLRATSTELSLFVWLLAWTIGLASLQMIRPAPTALVVGQLGTFVGALALSFPNHVAGVVLGLATMAASAAIGLALERPLIIVLGAVGFFMFDIRVFSLFARGAGTAFVAFGLGLCLVVFAVWHATHGSPSSGGRRSTGFEAGNGHPDSFEPS